jgi:hypothetical protein
MTKWWKCDLQVASPAWQFAMLADTAYDLSDPLDKRRFAARYIQKLVKKGIEVVALADHNGCDWIDLLMEEGAKQNVRSLF